MGKSASVQMVTCLSVAAQTKILETGLSIEGVDIVSEPFHYHSKRNIVCFGCGRNGHQSKNCEEYNQGSRHQS